MKSIKLILSTTLALTLFIASCKKDDNSNNNGGCSSGDATYTVNNNTNSAINITIGGQLKNNVAVGSNGTFTLNAGTYNLKYVPSNAPDKAYGEVDVTLASCESKTLSAETQWGDCVVNNKFTCNIYNNRYVSYTVYVDGIFQGSLSYQESVNVDLNSGSHSISATTSAIGYGDRNGSTNGAACENKSWTIQ